MNTFEYPNAAEALYWQSGRLMGIPVVAPRGQRTHEAVAQTIKISDPSDVLCTLMGRKMNIKIAAIEALSIVAGEQHPNLLCRVAPQFAQFRNGGAFHGAYGPRLRPQIPAILDRLADDPLTRQAVATIWDPALDLQEGVHDLPCTVYLSWQIRDGKLNGFTHMRSNDIWWGWTYDVVQFTTLLWSMAHAIGVGVGSYTHYADSLHLYERDHNAVHRLNRPHDDKIETRQRLRGIGWPGLSWQVIRDRAGAILQGNAIPGVSETERWFIETIKEDVL